MDDQELDQFESHKLLRLARESGRKNYKPGMARKQRIDAGYAFLEDNGLTIYLDDLVDLIHNCKCPDDLAWLLGDRRSGNSKIEYCSSDRLKLDRIFDWVEGQIDYVDDDQASDSPKPLWKSDEGRHGQLHYDGQLIKDFKTKSDFQTQLIAAFERKQWQQRISNPFLDSGNEVEAFERLKNTTESLNKSLTLKNVIQFGTASNRKYAVWFSIDQ